MAVDHYGVPFSGIEPDEVDQEQHDGVRDVFYVSHAAMLVRADLFHELGRLRPGDVPRRRRHRPLLARPARRRARDRRAAARACGTGRRPSSKRAPRTREARGRDRAPRPAARVRVLCKSYSALALIWVLPMAFVLGARRGRSDALFTGRVARAARARGGMVLGVRASRRAAPGALGDADSCAASTTATFAI